MTKSELSERADRLLKVLSEDKAFSQEDKLKNAAALSTIIEVVERKKADCLKEGHFNGDVKLLLEELEKELVLMADCDTPVNLSLSLKRFKNVLEKLPTRETFDEVLQPTCTKLGPLLGGCRGW